MDGDFTIGLNPDLPQFAVFEEATDAMQLITNPGFTIGDKFVVRDRHLVIREYGIEIKGSASLTSGQLEMGKDLFPWFAFLRFTVCSCHRLILNIEMLTCGPLGDLRLMLGMIPAS